MCQKRVRMGEKGIRVTRDKDITHKHSRKLKERKRYIYTVDHKRIGKTERDREMNHD